MLIVNFCLLNDSQLHLENLAQNLSKDLQMQTLTRKIKTVNLFELCELM